MLNAYGSLLAEHGPHDQAVEVLRRAAVVEPEAGHAKFMCDPT